MNNDMNKILSPGPSLEKRGENNLHCERLTDYDDVTTKELEYIKQ